MIRDSTSFAQLALRLESERAQAVPIAALIARAPEQYLFRTLPVSWQTIGLVTQLSSEAREELERSPERSLAIAQLAVSLAEKLPATYPRVLRAQAQCQAWKEVSNAHRFLNEYQSALNAIDEAERCAAPEPALGHDRAVLLMARAITYRELNRTTEALDVLQEAVETFRDYCDQQRLAQCELVVGMIHHRLGDRIAARQAYMRVIGAARSIGDVHTVAAAYNNLGQAAAESGEASAAMDAFHQARAIFSELHMTTELARVTWGIGTALLTSSRFEDALKLLTQARIEFTNLGMAEESGMAGIEMAEAYIAMNLRGSAEEVLAAVIEEFRSAGLSERALQAVGYLRDVADAATPAAARHVSSYVRRVKDEPALLFLPPEM
jgi:tetratricopeptide (TPR) repeat protein